MESIGSCTHLLILDAVRGPELPGTLLEKRDDEVPIFFRNRISPHQLGISDVLAMLTLTGKVPERMQLLGIVPESLETGLDLSATIAGKFELLVQRACEVIVAWTGQPPLPATAGREPAACV